MEFSINYLAVVVAAAVAFGVGAWWHSPVGFGRTWMRLAGMTEEKMKTMSLSPMQAMALGVAQVLLLAFVFAMFASWLGVASWQSGLQLGFWIWLGFQVPMLANGWLWEGKSLTLFAFNSAYQLVSIEVIALVIALWQ